ncbi:MBL fold metallo-hydrolase [Arthrobacter globiformis]|uniref:MBL fold metallo-hydrolase n=1 Tax=Arthrobacter globiformis TaxID=1665 RepID=UPI0027938A13|nr:MBL fold metallo-hydrolase [Arthrobacter globiformis]MDQ0618629.1 glyoxylase-like metal-dependent hydrolase (beta-lactamase superfamily II) [Arthrobacter globiformis]
MIRADVRDGVHLISHAHVYCYVIEDDDGVTLVNAGLPTMWTMLLRLLDDRGRRPEDVKALALTHGHFDHAGFALRAHRRKKLNQRSRTFWWARRPGPAGARS